MSMKKHIKNLGLAFLLMALITGLAGCGSKTIAIDPQVKYGNPSYEHLKDLPQVKYKESLYKNTQKDKVFEKTADEYEVLGDAMLTKKKFYMAFMQYEKSLKKNKDNIRVEYKKGLTFLAAKKTDEAKKQFEIVLAKQPDYSLAYEGLGRVNQLEKKYELAKINYQKAIALDPLLWNSYNRLGNIYDLEKKYNKAVKEYKTAIAVKPDLGFLYNNLGYSLFLTGQDQEAIKAFYKALELNYANKKVYNNLGMIFANLKLYDKAFEVYKKGGTEATAYNNLGVGYMKNGEIDEAGKCFSKAIEISPHFYTVANENLKKSRALQKQSQ